jgi:hypothetical protein
MKTDEASLNRIPLSLIRALWAVAALLVVVGVGAGIGRVVFADDLVTRAEPARQWLMDALHREDPFALQRPAELARVDGKFAAHPLLTLWHVLPGGVFLLFAPLQFSTWMRGRHIRIHRWSGRLLLPAALVCVLPGLYFGILIPYGGPAEAVAIAVFGGLFLIASCRGFLAIRRRQVAQHREWMIRVFAIAIAISTVRVVAVVLDVALTPAGIRPPDVFALSVWTGWVTTVGVAELWIRFTRPGRDALAVPKSAA